MDKKKQIIQYRDDLVRCFTDTEFYEDGSTIDLISIGACRSDGPEFYAINQDARLDRVSPWVRENVLPQLPPYDSKLWMPRKKIAEEYARFLGANMFEPKRDAVSEVWGYYADYDHVAVAQMYGTMMNLPKTVPMYMLDLKQLSWMLGNPQHPEQRKATMHNALEDARWERDVLFPFLRSVPSGIWGFGREP